MEERRDSSSANGGFDFCWVETDAQETSHEEGLRTDGAVDQVTATGQEIVSLVNGTIKPITAVERSSVGGSCQKKTDEEERNIGEHQLLLNNSHLSECVTEEVTPAVTPATALMQNENFSVGISQPDRLTNAETQNTGGGYCVVVDHYEKVTALEENKGLQRGAALPESQQIVLISPPNDQTEVENQAVDDGSGVAVFHQATPTVESNGEKMSYQSVLHLMQRQQKHKRGRRCKKKTLMKMAKLFVIAKGWNSEKMESSETKHSDGSLAELKLLEAEQKEALFASAPPQSEIDCDKDVVLSAVSENSMSSGQTTAPLALKEMTKTTERKGNPSTSKKRAETELSQAAETDCSSSTNLSDVPDLTQEYPLHSPPISKWRKKLKEISSVTFEKDAEIKCENGEVPFNILQEISTLDIPPTQTSKHNKKTQTGQKKRGKAAVKKSAEQKGSPQTLTDCNDAMQQAVNEGFLGLDVTESDGTGAGCTTSHTAAAEVSSENSSGMKSITEVLKPKRKRGRSVKVKTRVNKVLEKVCEGELKSDSNLCDISIGGDRTSQQPEYMNGPALASAQTELIHSSRSGDSSGLPLFVSPNDEILLQTENEHCAEQNMEDKTKPPKEMSKLRRSTQSDQSDVQSVPLSADTDPTKNVKKVRKKRMTTSKSKRKRGQSGDRIVSTDDVSQQKQNETCHDEESTNIPTPVMETPNLLLQKPRKRAANNRKCKVEAVDVPLSCQTDLSVSFCKYNVMNQFASAEFPQQTADVTPEPASEAVTAPLIKKRNSTTNRHRKRPAQKIKNTATVNAQTDETSADLEKEIIMISDPEKPRKGKGGRKVTASTTKRKAKDEQIIHLPDPPLIDIKIEPDEPMPINTTKTQACKKRRSPRQPKKPTTLTAVCGSGEETACLEPLGSQQLHEGAAGEAMSIKVETVASSATGTTLVTVQKSLKQKNNRIELKLETVTSAELDTSDIDGKGVSAQPEDSFVSCLQDPKNNIILNFQDNLTSPQDVRITGIKDEKSSILEQGQLITGGIEDGASKVKEEAANSENVEKCKGKKKRFTVRRRPKVAASVEDNGTWAGEVHSAESGFTSTSMLENVLEKTKYKRKKRGKIAKETPASVGSAEGFDGVVGNVPHPDIAPVNQNLAEDVKAKCKKRSIGVELRTHATHFASFGGHTKESSEIAVTGDGTEKKSKLSSAKNRVSNLQGGKCEEKTSAVTLPEDTPQIENNSASNNDPQSSVGVDSVLPKTDVTREVNIKKKSGTKAAMKQPEQISDEQNPSESLLKPELISSEIDTAVLTKQEIGIKKKSGRKRGKRKASPRACKAAKAAKMEDDVSRCDLDSLIQDSVFSNVDLNIDKEEQDGIEMFEHAGEADSACQDEIRPADPPVVPPEKTQTKAKRKRRRRDRTGWDRKKISKRSQFCNPVNLFPCSSADASALPLNSSPCNSISGDDVMKLRDVNGDSTEPQTPETLCTQTDNLQNPKAQNNDDAEEVTEDAKLERSLEIKKSNIHRQKLKCSFCGRSFRHISAFTVHRRIHTGEKPYRCLKCSKSFAQRSQLDAHSRVHDEPQAVHCPCCGQKFENKDDLINHFQVHTKDIQRWKVTEDSDEGKVTNTDSPVPSEDSKPFRCSTCLKEFSNKAVFEKHQQMHRRVKSHTCSVCGEKFQKPSSLHVHEKTHWPVKPYACSVCGEAFLKLLELKSHSKMHSGAAPFSCATCEEAFSSFASLRSHQFSKVCYKNQDAGDRNQNINGFLLTVNAEGQRHAPTSYKCPVCEQPHRFWCQCILHFRTHTNDPLYFCEVCRRQYDKPLEKKNHCSVCCRASGEERACRSMASEVWREAETAQNQVIKTLSNDDHSLLPEVDQKGQSSFSSIAETHEKEVTDIQSPPPSPSASVNDDFDISVPSPNSNDECSGPASCPETSRVHDQTDHQPSRFGPQSLIRRHCGRYSCGECGKSFNSWNKLWLHRPLHRQTGRPFSCTQCDLEFRFLGSYIDHLREHAAQRPYACPLCPDTFANEEDLSTHSAKCHKSRDCMKCSTCGKTFSTLTNLKKHKLLHKGASSHFCLACDLSFPTDCALRTHLETHRTRLRVPQPTGVIEPFLFPYHCRKCTAKFTSTDLLHAHQICHFTVGEKAACPSDAVVSRLPTNAKNTLRDIAQRSQRKRPLPVSNKKHLFRYPNPDRLYVVPVMSSEPPIVISDTEEDRQETPPTASSPSKALISDFDEPEHKRQDALVLGSSKKSPIHGESPQDQETSGDATVSGSDKDPSEPSQVLMKCKEEPVDQIHSCAVCTAIFTDILKLHEHYMDHAKGL